MPKPLPFGLILFFYFRLTSCPQCQYYKPSTHKLYLNFDENVPTVKELKDQLRESSNEIHGLKTRLYDRNIAMVHDRMESEKEIGELRNLVTDLRNKIVCLEGAQQKHRQQILSLTEEVSSYQAYSETAVADMKKENDSLKTDLENISTELAIEVSKNQQSSATATPVLINLNKEKIEALEQKVKHISGELENEIKSTMQLQIENMKLKHLIECMKSNSLTANSDTNDVEMVDVEKRSSFHSLSPTPPLAHETPNDTTNEIIDVHSLHFKENTGKSESSTSNSIIIQNYPSQRLIRPLENTVIFLAEKIGIHLTKSDIDHVKIMAEHSDKVVLFVRFNRKQLKATFLENQYRLNRNSTKCLRAVHIKEYIDSRILELFQYAKYKLLENGFKNVFLTNNEVFSKKNSSDRDMIQIFTKQQVDELASNN